MQLPPQQDKLTIRELWKQFLPLSLSDVTMAFADPAITTTLAHLPGARVNLAAVGVAKSLAVFFESPIIMLLHASNALAGSRKAREALWRFTLISMTILSSALLVLSLPPVFSVIGNVLGISEDVAVKARWVLCLMVLWPAAIAWRRYFQGLLIRFGYGKAVGRAGLGRLWFVVALLASGYLLGMNGAVLGGLALVGGVFFEALLVTRSARMASVFSRPDSAGGELLPSDLKAVTKFYWPLANSMLVVWGGRACLVAVIARAFDGGIALAVWPAAWGLVLLVGNATRMVQQVVIRNRGNAPDELLIRFTASVGAVCAAILVVLSASGVGHGLIHSFVGGDAVLAGGVARVILICSGFPFLIAFQNAFQGFLIGESRTSRINAATWLGTTVLLVTATLAVVAGTSGAVAAALAMGLAILTETTWLYLGIRRTKEGEPSSILSRTIRFARGIEKSVRVG